MQFDFYPRYARFFRTGAVLCAVFAVAVACAGLNRPKDDTRAVPLDDGVVQLTDELLARVPGGEQPRRVVAVDRFVDAASGEVPKAASRIESIMLGPGAERNQQFKMVRLTSESGSQAAYLIAGSIFPESGEKDRYRLRGVIKNLRTDEIAGSAAIQVFAPGLDYTPMAIFRDNPFFDPGYRKKTIDGEVPKQAGPPGFENYSVQTLSLLRAASEAYERGDPETALDLFGRAERRPDGRTLWTYAGMYLAYRNLGRSAEAEKAFKKVVSLSVEKHRMLSVRFLFKVDSVDFWGGDEESRRYRTWLRHIGDYFSRTAHCLKIVGHCSKTGPETWNQSLSRMRALKIQKMLAETMPEAGKRTMAVGMGSARNVVGTGTDDERDVLDRRVELMIVDCP